MKRRMKESSLGGDGTRDSGIPGSRQRAKRVATVEREMG